MPRPFHLAFQNELDREVTISAERVEHVHLKVEGPDSEITLDITLGEAGNLHDALGHILGRS